ncbi:hypothetical protein DSO57_1011338 [Entomophthora muscae]|uniref:Uncharacterized protein n=1 Tax=Entomophthora muscae TaxID=34485 RepID=A0ACC2U400_9FUNG|nr:hypothetical protein DSO57_1011338 [Entomophthora muscae]
MGLTINRPTSTSTKSQRSSTPPRRTPGPRWCCPAPPSTWMMMVYPILTALMGFQVTNLVPYLARILPHFMGLYIMGFFQFDHHFGTGLTGSPEPKELD